MPRFFLIATFLTSGCLTPRVREDLRQLKDSLDRESSVFTSSSSLPPAQPAPSRPAVDEPRPPSFLEPGAPDTSPLADGVDLQTLLAEALRRNPELAEAESRARASLEAVKSAGALDDPVFKVETEAVPIHKPVAFDRSDDNMFGLSQSFPFPGKLGLRSRSALADAQAQYELLRASKSDVIARLKKAYFAYFMITKELEIHQEHERLLEDFERITEARFRNGATQEQDVLKAQLELVMLHNDVLNLEQALGSTKATINTLVNRRADAPLGKPKEINPTEGQVDLQALQDRALASRPELQALRGRARAAQAASELSQQDAWLPDLMVGVDYWQVNQADDAWGGFVSINLPWLTGKKAAEARKMRHMLRAEELATERGARQVLFEVQDSYLRVEAARTSFLLIRGELLPKARQNVEVTRTSYENSRTSFLELLVAERSLRDIQLSFYRALAEHESAIADLERAAGTNLKETP